jgi:hypothetical protein
MMGRCANSTSQTGTQVESNSSTKARQGTEVTVLDYTLLALSSLRRVHEAFHFHRPPQKTPEVSALSPEKFPEFDETDLLHFQAAIGLNPP